MSELCPCLRLVFPFLLLLSVVTSFKFLTDLPRSPFIGRRDINVTFQRHRRAVLASIPVLATIQPRVMSGKQKAKAHAFHYMDLLDRVGHCGRGIGHLVLCHLSSRLELFTSGIFILAMHSVVEIQLCSLNASFFGHFVRLPKPKRCKFGEPPLPCLMSISAFPSPSPLVARSLARTHCIKSALLGREQGSAHIHAATNDRRNY